MHLENSTMATKNSGNSASTQRAKDSAMAAQLAA